MNIIAQKNEKYYVCFQCCRFVLPSCEFLAACSKVSSFFCSITFKNVQIFHQNSIFVAETHVYTKPLTPNRRLLPSSARLISE